LLQEAGSILALSQLVIHNGELMTGFLFSGGGGGGGGSQEGIFNVKTFGGAIGNGVANDTAAVITTFAAAWNYGVNIGSNAKGAIVFFPAGAYRVNQTISSTGQGSNNISIAGSGMHNTMLVGSIDDGFILDKPDENGAGIISICDIQIVNESVASSFNLQITSATWSAGTITYNTLNPLTDINWTSGSRRIRIPGVDYFADGINPTAMGGYFLVGNRTGANQFQVTGMADPGATYVGGGHVYLVSGALRYSFQSSGNLENIFLQGMIGLDAGSDQFQSRYANIACNGPGGTVIPSSIGMICCDATFVGCNILGFGTGYRVGGVTTGSNSGAPGTNFIGCRVEVCEIGFDLGKNSLDHVVSCGVTMVGCQSERCTETIVCRSVGPLQILGGAFTGTCGVGHYFYISSGGSLTWSAGQATLTIPPSLPSLNDYGWTGGTREVVIDSAEATRNTITNPTTWNLGTITYTTVEPLTNIGWTTNGTTRILNVSGIMPPSMAILNGTGTRTGTNTFTISGFPDPGQPYNSAAPTGPGTVSISPGYNTLPGHVTATWQGTPGSVSRQFKYPVAVDPGGPNINNYALWSFMQQSCIKLLNAGYGLFSGVGMSIADPDIAQVDMTNLDGGYLTFQSMPMGNYDGIKSFTPPAGARKAGIKFDNCGVVSLDITFADLQGHTGVWLNSYGDPKEGEEYNIIDCIPATPMAIAKGGGTGLSARRKIRFQGYAACTLARSGSTVTATTSVNHGLTGTNHLYIKGALEGRDRPHGVLGDYNGYIDATVTGVNTFQYTIAGTPATPATGSIFYGYWQVIG